MIVERDRKRHEAFHRNEIIAADLKPAELAAARARGFRVVSRTLQRPGTRKTVVRLRAPRRLSTKEAREALRALNPHATIDVNHHYYLQGGKVSGCAASDCQWPLALMNWQQTAPGCQSSVPIGLLDTSIARSDLNGGKGRIETVRLARKGTRPAPADHGTAVASIILGAKQGDLPGLAANASLFAADVFFLDDRGQPATDAETIVDALNWLSANGVRLVNLSFAGPANEVLSAAIRDFTAAGMVFVAAAGNNGPEARPSYPAAEPGVIAVTAVDQWQMVYNRANQGQHIALAAPGVGLRLTGIGGRRTVVSGTSYATPFVTAALASNFPTDSQVVSRDTLLDRFEVSDLGAPGHDPIFGRGLLQAPTACRGSLLHVKATHGDDTKAPAR